MALDGRDLGRRRCEEQERDTGDDLTKRADQSVVAMSTDPYDVSRTQKKSTQSLRENRSEHVDGWSWDENDVGLVDEVGLSTECHGFGDIRERERDLASSRRDPRSRCERIAASTSVDGTWEEKRERMKSIQFETPLLTHLSFLPNSSTSFSSQVHPPDVLAAILSQRLRGSLLDVRSLSRTTPIRGTPSTNQLHPRVERRSPLNSIHRRARMRFSRNDCVDFFWTPDLSLKHLQSVAFRRQTSFIHASNGVLLTTPSTYVLACDSLATTAWISSGR